MWYCMRNHFYHIFMVCKMWVLFTGNNRSWCGIALSARYILINSGPSFFRSWHKHLVCADRLFSSSQKIRSLGRANKPLLVMFSHAIWRKYWESLSALNHLDMGNLIRKKNLVLEICEKCLWTSHLDDIANKPYPLSPHTYSPANLKILLFSHWSINIKSFSNSLLQVITISMD